MRVIQQKAKTLRNQHMIPESEKFQQHYETLLAELEMFYQKYRNSLVKSGIAPKFPLRIELTAPELAIIKAMQKEHGLRF